MKTFLSLISEQKTRPPREINISQVDKLDNVKSWSQQALTTCPGAYDDGGHIVPACQGCYARGGRYNFPNVKRTREENSAGWKKDNWVRDMRRGMINDRFFRWFDSGDIDHPELAEKIYHVMKNTPHVQHWLPTRSYKIPEIKPWLDKMNELKNVTVRYSSDHVDGTLVDQGSNTSTIISPGQKPPEGVYKCPAGDQGGQCGTCRACYNKNIKHIAYTAHGREALKVAKLHQLTDPHGHLSNGQQHPVEAHDNEK